MKNLVTRLFDVLNKEKINYCVIRKYRFLPSKFFGDIDLAVKKEDFRKVDRIFRKQGLIFYHFTQPHYFYFGYDKHLGLVKFDVIKLKNLPIIKRFKNFYVMKDDGEKFRIKKSFLLRIYTFLMRKVYYLFKGKVFCFIGPDGSGKSTLVKKTLETLKDFPIKTQKIYFGTKKGGKFYRIFDLIKKIINIYLNILLGKITLTDRYIYLTFRENKILQKIIRFIAPTPNVVFLAKISPKRLLRRKKEIDEKEIKKQYKLFESIKNVIKINTEKNIERNIEEIVNVILHKFS